VSCHKGRENDQIELRFGRQDVESRDVGGARKRIPDHGISVAGCKGS
jgi:hypothetical protein